MVLERMEAQRTLRVTRKSSLIQVRASHQTGIRSQRYAGTKAVECSPKASYQAMHSAVTIAYSRLL